jgi:acetyltransferase-like isoleucine patch superfamily enzyme
LSAGEDCQIRRGCTLSIGGDLTLDGGNTLGYGTVVHCAHAVHVGRLTLVAEYCTVVDSSHVHTAPDRSILHGTVTGTVDIGENVFVAPRVSVGRDVKIGDFTIVGPNSTVVGSLPSRVLASGVPARVVHTVPVPWEEGS